MSVDWLAEILELFVHRENFDSGKFFGKKLGPEFSCALVYYNSRFLRHSLCEV
jgi:hypothetical protein